MITRFKTAFPFGISPEKAILEWYEKQLITRRNNLTTVFEGCTALPKEVHEAMAEPQRLEDSRRECQNRESRASSYHGHY